MNKIKIALPTSDRLNIEEHFGHSKYLFVVTLENSKIIKEEFIEKAKIGLENISDFFKEKNINKIISFNIGQKALNKLDEKNIRVIAGVSGGLKEIVNLYLEDKLVSKENKCNRHNNFNKEHKRNCTCNH